MHSLNKPPHRIVTCIPERREPGTIIFNIRPGGWADLTGKFGWIVGIDRKGEFAINWEFDQQPQDTCVLGNGNILFSLPKGGELREVTRTGQLVRSWHVPDELKGQPAPKDSIPLDISLFHHRINVFPNGNFLLLGAEARNYDNWPQKDDDPNALRGPAKVVGDIIYEISQSGKVVNQWSMLDILDPYRLSYGSCSVYWHQRGIPDSFDWCHANAATYDPSDDSIIVSLRTQDCVIKFERATGKLKWILGDHGNWKAPWKEKLLKPMGDLEWQYHQHDCSVTPQGNILCFDNGNFRAVPFGKKMAAVDSYSRAVEFAVDESAMTVRQVWSYGAAPEERLFSCYQSGALRLPKTGNTLITYGGVSLIDGKPTFQNHSAYTKARVIEVTPSKEIVFDMWFETDETSKTEPLSIFRAECLPD
jgi:hypothetical protein